MPRVRGLILQGLAEAKGLLGVTFGTRCVQPDTSLSPQGAQRNTEDVAARESQIAWVLLSLPWRFGYRYRLGRGMGL
jgi:hypothetical protein